MAEVRKVFGDLGYREVQIYLQTGNVVFEHTGGEPDGVAAEVEKHIYDDLGVATTVLLRTEAELAAVLAGNPYLDVVDDLTKLHVTFLAAEPTPALAAALEVPQGETAQFTLAGRDVYLHTPQGYGRTKINNAFLEKQLGVSATTRGWKTVATLADLAAG